MRETHRREVGLHIEGRVITRIRDAQRPGLVGRIEHPIAGANHCLLGQLIGETDARGQVVAVLRNQLARRVTINGNLREEAGRQSIGPAAGNVERAARDVVVGFAVAPLLGHGDELVANAQVQSQLAGDFEIVLHIEEVARLLECIVNERSDRRIGGDAEGKIGKPQAGVVTIIRIAGIVAVEGEGAAGSRRLQNAEVHNRLPLHAELDRVTACDPAQVLDEMVDILEFTSRLIGGASERADAADVETRQTAVVRSEGNAGNSDLAGKIIIGIELQTLGSQPRVARAEFVDNMRREDVGLAENSLPGVVRPIAR